MSSFQEGQEIAGSSALPLDLLSTQSWHLCAIMCNGFYSEAIGSCGGAEMAACAAIEGTAQHAAIRPRDGLFCPAQCAGAPQGLRVEPWKVRGSLLH